MNGEGDPPAGHFVDPGDGGAAFFSSSPPPQPPSGSLWSEPCPARRLSSRPGLGPSPSPPPQLLAQAEPHTPLFARRRRERFFFFFFFARPSLAAAAAAAASAAAAAAAREARLE
jgi:hypothetical protein